MANRLVSLVALIVATGTLVALRRSSSRPRLALEAPKAAPVPVQTWEGEGGALPATGAQMGPDPAVGGTGDGMSSDDDRQRQGAIPGIH